MSALGAVASVASAGSVLSTAAALRRARSQRVRSPGTALRGVGPTLGGRWVSAISRSSRGEDSRLALEQIQASLHAGWSLLGALRRLADQPGPWSREARVIVEEVGGGASVFAALDRWAASTSRAEVKAFADAVALAGTTGASQALAIETALSVIDEGRASAQELRAATAQHRASAAALVAVPLGFAGVLCLADPRVAAFYLRDSLGLGCVAVGVTLDAVGGWWLWRLVRSVP